MGFSISQHDQSEAGSFEKTLEMFMYLHFNEGPLKKQMVH